MQERALKIMSWILNDKIRNKFPQTEIYKLTPVAALVSVGSLSRDQPDGIWLGFNGGTCQKQ